MTEVRTEHKTRTTLPKCDVCGAPATHGVLDSGEIQSTDANGWREFTDLQERRGCAAHVVTAMTYYRDGRIIPSAQCQPEQCGKPLARVTTY